MPIQSGLVARFKRQLANGEVVLFTGAGFSAGAVAADGRPVITSGELARELARLAFGPSAVVDDGSTLADLFELANARAQGALRRLLDTRLRIDASKTPERYADWFSMPWKRIYTLNVDDLDEALNTSHSLPREIQSVSGLNHTAVQTQDLLSIHLNGRIAEFPAVTFGVRQYAQRSIASDPWYEMLTSDLLSSPVLFIGTVLNEQSLWQHIEMRSTRQPSDVELRPPSYLVSPSLPKARAALLRRFNIDWIDASENDFYEEVIAKATQEAEQGRQALARLHHPTTAASTLKPLPVIRSSAKVTDPKLFLRGRDPEWGDVDDGGFAVVRDFEPGLLQAARAKNKHVTILTGTAASGKTTTAMRLALALQAGGIPVHVYDGIEGSRRANSILKAARAAHPEMILIDDVDVFGEAAGRLMAELVEVPGVRGVIATVRSSRLQGLSVESDLDGVSYSEYTIPSLCDADIDLVLEALDRAGSLGRMTGLTLSDRRKILREMAGRQLVVAMFYATSGELLEDRIRGECEDLSGAARFAYGMTALATSEHQYVTKPELLVGLGALGYSGDGNNTLNQIDKLVERELLIPRSHGFEVRHRWIAETSLDFFTGNGLLHKVILSLAFALASEVDAQTNSHSRERRLLRRLINHDRLLRAMDDVDACREVYVALQDRLRWDHHYWLQRGSLEVERGDLDLARTYLDSARSLVDGTDRWVENEYAYLTLKKAASDPRAAHAAEQVATAFASLEEAMRTRGRDDPYPYHVYGSQGLSWARRAALAPEERKELVGKLLNAVSQGRAYHPKREDLKQLESDLQREYLLLATR